MAESVSAANEVKLTEAEALVVAFEERRGESMFTADRNLLRDTILGARLSAREPDNEAVERLISLECAACGLPIPNPGTVEHVCPSSPYSPTAVPVSGVPTEAVRELAEQFVHIADRTKGDTRPLCWYEYAGHDAPCTHAGPGRWGEPPESRWQGSHLCGDDCADPCNDPDQVRAEGGGK